MSKEKSNEITGRVDPTLYQDSAGRLNSRPTKDDYVNPSKRPN